MPGKKRDDFTPSLMDSIAQSKKINKRRATFTGGTVESGAERVNKGSDVNR